MPNKFCPRCKQDLDISLFNRNTSNKSGLADECKTCKKKLNEAHYIKNKDTLYKKYKDVRKETSRYIRNYKSERGCSVCGETHPACLQFHHLDPKEKESEISAAMFNGWSIEKLLAEIKKCVILCANCHFKLHYPFDDVLETSDRSL